ncbi:hypothetical protein ACQ4PT_056787 [Festuca glaucescens]
MKDCRTFLQLHGAVNGRQAEAARQGYGGAAGAVAPNAPPPPPLPANGGQQQQAGNGNQNGQYPPPKGADNMIHKGRPTNRTQKLIIRQVNLVIKSPPPTPEYLNWSDHRVEFSRDDHPPSIPRLGHSPLVLSAQIGGFKMNRVSMDAGTGINLMYADTLRAMNISLTNLAPSDTCFHGVAPGKANIPLGKIALDAIFGTRENFRSEKIEFEVMDWPSQYNVILERPVYARFMVVPHYTYLLLKIPGPNGIITVKGSFDRSDKCDREFHKLSESFSMAAEYAKLKDSTNHDVPPTAGRSLPDQAFDSAKDTREVQVHPSDLTKTTSIVVNLDSA